MCVAVEFNEFHRRTQNRRRLFRLGHPLRRFAVRCSFAARANDKMRRAAGAGFFRNDATAAEFDVVGMRAEGQQRRGFRTGFRCRLHRHALWYRDL